MTRKVAIRAVITAITVFGVVVSAAVKVSTAQSLDAGALTDMSLEELTKVRVTSASKREQSLQTVASALFVIGQNDIRRSTATCFPELLRMVPGMKVARVNAYTWAVTARGFGGVFANKLLVLIDGRTVYTPLFSGTYWEVQDYPLEDIERIEVIRGPGGTLWGSNAVTGVINIITKKSIDTQGLLTSLATGNETHAIGNVRYGWKTDSSSGRVYGRGRVIDASVREAGASADDGFNSAQGGFKFDQKLSSSSSVTLQGDIYSMNESERLNVPQPLPPFEDERGRTAHVRGGNVLTKVSTDGFGEGDKSSVQFYFDRAERDELVANTAVSTYDLETQYEVARHFGHALTFGSGVRTIVDSIGTDRLVTGVPDSRQYSLVNAFLQDEYQIIPERLSVTAGVKFEHNEFTGGVWQPSVRSSWEAARNVTVWGAVSKAVRIPSRVSNDVRAPIGVNPPSARSPVPIFIDIRGNRSNQPEEVVSYETGVRSRLSDSVALDSALFLADYSRLETFDLGPTEFAPFDGVPTVRQPLVAGNNGRARAWGIENVIDWTPASDARIQLWHSLQVISTKVIKGGTDFFLEGEENSNPVNQVGIRGQFDLPLGLEFNPFVRYVDSITQAGAHPYWEADMQLAWRASDSFRLSLNVVNTLRDQFLESRSDFINRPDTKTERSFFLNMTYQY